MHADLLALETQLARRHRTRESEVVVGTRTITLVHPASADELISEVEFDADGRLPYWADLWPSARVLAAHVVALPGRGRRLLELGCGAGLVATAAAFAGFEVTASDYYQDACAFARLNAWRATGDVIATRLLDWRHLSADLGTWDVVVASDVLYEMPYAALVAEVLDRTLAPGGVAIIADPGRMALESFVAACRTRGLEPGEPEPVPYDFDGQRQTIRVFTIRRVRALTAPTPTP